MLRKIGPWRFVIACVSLVMLASALVSPTSAHVYDAPGANYPPPSWWNGDTCDSTHFNASGQTAVLLTTWKGVQVCGPRRLGDGATNVAVQFVRTDNVVMSTENEWECTELVKRYLYQAFGLDSISGNGDAIVGNYYNTYGTGSNPLVTKLTNGVAHEFPKVGDVFSHSYGHTSIVTGVTVTNASTGDGTVSIIEQNFSATGQRTLSITGWTVGDSVSGWLHPLAWKDISPAAQSGVLGTNLTGMSAVSPTQVWAVGHYKSPSTGYWYPLMQLYNGSTWSVKSPSPPNWSAGYNLYGTAAAANGNAWAVGYRGDTHGTLAYKLTWTNANPPVPQWVVVPSDNGSPPGGDNYLRAVADDGNGHIWAVGYYVANGYSCPSGRGSLIERYDSTSNTFVAIANAPPTTACAELYGVTVTSATNAWAVGRYFEGNTSRLLILHYDGTSWTQDTSVTATTSGGWFTGVYAPSDTEAWAVGNWPLLLYHYKNGAWTKDTSISTILGNTKVYGVAGSSANDVWVGGSYSPSTGTTAPYLLHWDGAEWIYYNTSYPASQVNVEAWAVAANSGKAWFGAYRQPSGTYNAYPFVQEFGQ